jgi:osmoprotectant transport system permease protein
MTDIWSYLTDHWSGEIEGWLWTTIWLAIVPLVVGLLLALPLGWIASRYRWTYPPIATGMGLLYTIPSLVVFLVLPGIINTKILAPINVAVALTLYTLALLTRIVADGLSSVDDVTLSASTAMGYTGRQQFFRVQLPLAVPVIGAGLRVAAVSNTSLISVASIIGVAQLGQLFIAGQSTGNLSPLWLGLIMFVLLALVLDIIILIGTRILTPWQRARAAR